MGSKSTPVEERLIENVVRENRRRAVWLFVMAFMMFLLTLAILVGYLQLKSLREVAEQCGAFTTGKDRSVVKTVAVWEVGSVVSATSGLPKGTYLVCPVPKEGSE